MNPPLVSCIMPTRNRHRFLPAAIDCFLRQSYEQKELIILNDAEEYEKIPKEKNILQYMMKRVTLGEKRNIGCEIARGEIICHFDDDDFSTPDRIAYQVDLMQQEQKQVTGFGRLLFYDEEQKVAKLFETAVRNYVCGTSLMYTKKFWSTHRFAPRWTLEDNAFVYPILHEIAASDELNYIIARIHSGNSEGKKDIQTLYPAEKLAAEFWENERILYYESEDIVSSVD